MREEAEALRRLTEMRPTDFVVTVEGPKSDKVKDIERAVAAFD